MMGAGADGPARARRRFRHADGVGPTAYDASRYAPMPRPRSTRGSHASSAPRASGCAATEHMFFDAARITAVRQMILAEDEQGRRLALDKLLPEQRADFIQLFEVMAGLPVTNPPARSTAARIPATRRGRVRRGRDCGRGRHRLSQAPRGGTARIQPDARPSRVPSWRHLSRNLRDAGARDLRGGDLRWPREIGCGADPRSDDPAGRDPA